MQEVNDRRGRGWAWSTLFVVMGGIYVMDGLRGGADESYRLLMGAGFLLAAPQAFFSPISFGKLGSSESRATFVDWVGMGGVVLLVAGLLVRWL